MPTKIKENLGFQRKRPQRPLYVLQSISFHLVGRVNIHSPLIGNYFKLFQLTHPTFRWTNLQDARLASAMLQV